MNIFVTSAVMFSVALVSVPAPALEPRAPYDDFSGTSLDPDKWVGSDRLYGSFFNTGAPSPGSHVNDVVARIQVGRSSASMEPANVLRVNTRVYQCLDPDCLDGAELYSQDLGSITLGQSTTLTLQWDQPTHHFIFQRDSQAPVVFAYAFSDVTPPGRPNKRIDTAVDVPACMSAPRPDALAQQFIENVLVNQSAAPNP